MARKKMTQAKALRLIKKHKPTTLLETHSLGLRLRHLGSGAFRKAYHIKDTQLVIKFSESSDFGMSLDHTKDEIKAITKLSKIKALKPHLPRLYYTDTKAGVLVTHYYPKSPTNYDYRNRLPEILGAVLHDFTGVEFFDGYIGNTRIEEDPNNSGSWRRILKFIDLGC